MTQQAHTESVIKTNTTVSTANGLFNWKNPDQAIVHNVERNNYKLQPQITPPGTFVQSGNQYVDYKLTKEITGSVEEMEWRFTLNNANASPVSTDTSVPFWVDRVEVRSGSQILQTIENDALYLNNSAYVTRDELRKYEQMNLVDKDTFGHKAVSIPANDSYKFILKIRTLLNSGVILNGLKQELTIRIYSRAISAWSSDANRGDISLSDAHLWVREVRHLEDVEQKPNMAYRHLDYVHEQANINFSAGTTTKYITNNFSEQDLASHIVCLVRNAGAANTDAEDLKQVNEIYLEDESGRNLNNGNQYSDAEMASEYLKVMPNSMPLSGKAVFVFTHSQNPTEDHNKGSVNGYAPLKENFKVCINPNHTGTHQLDIYARVYKLVLVNNGVLTYQ